MNMLDAVENQDQLDELIEKLEELLDGVEMVVTISALSNMLVECFVEIGNRLNPDSALNTFASVTEQMQIELEEILDIDISEKSN